MDRVRIARRLMRIARSLMAEDDQIANEEGREYENFTGFIDYRGSNGKVNYATFRLMGGKIYWEKGIWISGTWKNGIWKTGAWFNGAWESGIWRNGLWRSGTWENGFWRKGIFGHKDNDDEETNKRKEQETVWKSGIWQDGTWMIGKWLGGIWKKGKDGKGKVHRNPPSEW